jgi:hypothetical protein
MIAAMQEHNFSVDIRAPLPELWDMFWYRAPDRPQGKLGSIQILHPGNEIGEGLVRHCTFPVPKFLLSGGVGKSWEWLTEVKYQESWKYDAVGKPLWSRAEGFTRLEALDDENTRIHFRERYWAFNPWMRRIGLEKYVHDQISRDNDSMIAALEGGVQWHRARRAKEAAAAEKAGATASTAAASAPGE